MSRSAITQVEESAKVASRVTFEGQLTGHAIAPADLFPGSATASSGVNLMEANPQKVFEGSLVDHVKPQGANLLSRTTSFFEWQDRRRSAGYWPYSNTLGGRPDTWLPVSKDTGHTVEGLNFASQDYLGLGAHPAIIQAAHEALDRFGPHSAGSPCLQGNTIPSLQLEQALSEALQMDHVLLFPTGWAAGFGAVAGLVRRYDHVVIDHLIHNCLSVGAYAATQNVHRIPHLDVTAVARTLQQIRADDARNGILVITEGLFSMDADAPDVFQLQQVCTDYEATLLIDVAHDFGSMGPNGTGTIGLQGMLGKVDLVMGSFSKTFVSNGGFVATGSKVVREYLKYYAPPHVFSNALSPVQASIVMKALRIIRSPEGEKLRQDLLTAVNTLRASLSARGIHCLGDPSPIVPVPLGNERIARITAKLAFERGLHANLVEFPAVAVNQARFRMQVMARHSVAQAQQAARLVSDALRDATQLAEQMDEHPFMSVPEPFLVEQEII